MVSSCDITVFREHVLIILKDRGRVLDILFIKSPLSLQHSCRSEQSDDSLASHLLSPRCLRNILLRNSAIGCDSTKTRETRETAINDISYSADQDVSEVGSYILDWSNISLILNVSGNTAPLHHQKETVGSQSEVIGTTYTPEHLPVDSLQSRHVQKTSLNLHHSHERISSFDIIPQERAAECEHLSNDVLYHEQTRATPCTSFIYSFYDIHTEIIRHPYDPMKGLSIYKI